MIIKQFFAGINGKSLRSARCSPISMGYSFISDAVNAGRLFRTDLSQMKKRLFSMQVTRRQ